MVAVTANARYIHTALGLRYLVAALQEAGRTPDLMELTIEERAADAVEKILARKPDAVLLGVHIWNTGLMTEIAALIRRLRPSVALVAGGPEVSYQPETHPIFPWVDTIVGGEGEEAIVRVLRDLEKGTSSPKMLRASPPDLTRIPLPYHLYTDEDIRHRVLYFETSRGCPLRCEFCLSALDEKVRRFPEERVLGALDSLWQRGARQFKFVDRALHLGAAEPLLDYFLEKRDPAVFLHFEVIPDRLPEALISRLAQFPKGRVQLEAGIQTLNEAVAARISRKQNTSKALETLASLRSRTGVHLHADLVVGLPGETLASFADGFNRLFALGLHEIQVGILKKLRGALIARHDDEHRMVYNPEPPYDILENRDIDFTVMQQLKRFSRFFDLVCNRGNFRHLIPLLIDGDAPFDRLWHISSYLYEKTGRCHSIALGRLAEMLRSYAVDEKGIAPSEVSRAVEAGARTAGRASRGDEMKGIPARQQRHL